MVKKVRRQDTFEDVLEVIRPASRAMERGLKIGIYGRPGVGKTTLAGTFPSVLIVDCNQRGTMPLELKRAANVSIYDLTEWKQIERVYRFLRRGEHKFRSVFLDDIPSLASLGMSHVLKEAVERDLAKDPNMPDRRDWGKLAQLMKPTILNFRNLSMNVGFIFTERGSGGSEDDISEEEIGPEVQPAVKAIALGAVDILGRLYVKQREKGGKKIIERRLFVGASDRFLAKDRSGRLGRVVVNPTFREIHRLIYGGK